LTAAQFLKLFARALVALAAVSASCAFKSQPFFKVFFRRTQ
jgi:hypothetical protein